MHLGMPRAVPQVSAPGGQDWSRFWEKLCAFTREPVAAFPGRAVPRGAGVVSSPPPRYLRAVRGPGDTGWQRGRGNGSTISFHKLKLVLIS